MREVYHIRQGYGALSIRMPLMGAIYNVRLGIYNANNWPATYQPYIHCQYIRKWANIRTPCPDDCELPVQGGNTTLAQSTQMGVVHNGRQPPTFFFLSFPFFILRLALFLAGSNWWCVLSGVVSNSTSIQTPGSTSGMGSREQCTVRTRLGLILICESRAHFTISARKFSS